MMPAFFIAHGSPMLAVEESAYSRFLSDLGQRLHPKAVILFSAHWESDPQLVSGVDQYTTIHDFGGFPEALYQIRYPARGDAGLTGEVSRRLGEAGVPHTVDVERGLDHGAWVVLRKLFPQADVPVVAMSVNPGASPQAQYGIGRALAGLRAQDVLIIGSGGTVHNFRTLRWDAQDDRPDPWAAQFDDWLTDRATAWDLEALFAYASVGPNARLAVPPHGNEHFVPFFYAMGAADDQRIVRELHRSYVMGNLSQAVWQFGE